MGKKFKQDLVRGSLDLLVLSVIADAPKYGYLIQKDVREATGGEANLAAGTLYPLLHRLEAKKWIRSQWEETSGRPRKWYSLTAVGRKRLVADARQWHDFAAAMSNLLAGVLKSPAEPA
jgi:DNA-binding PadR family transcriptional regulator